MTDIQKDKDNDNSSGSKENIFQIMDGILVQLNKTKKLFIIMILSIMIVPPITFAVTFALLGPPFPIHDIRPHDRFGPGFNPLLRIGYMIPVIISIVWLGVGIWQWFVLSKWSKKYERYKELQKRIDEKLDYGDNHDEGKKDNH
jgi:hypothetical protein